jgi:hypothetical protein
MADMATRKTGPGTTHRDDSFERAIAAIAGRFLQADGNGMDAEIERALLQSRDGRLQLSEQSGPTRLTIRAR